MSDLVSRKAIETKLEELYNQLMAAGAYRVAIKDVAAAISSLPSKESEGEAAELREEIRKANHRGTIAKDGYDHIYKLWEQVRAENERLQASLKRRIADQRHWGNPVNLEIAKELQAVLDDIQALPSTSETTIQLRPAVLWFAEQMELVLRKNDYKGGWQDCDFDYLEEKLVEEVNEVLRELFANSNFAKNDEKIIKEAADVANIAMMIADIARKVEMK